MRYAPPMSRHHINNTDTLIIRVIQRWGDAPVHSIAASLFASRDQIHFFNEIGYEHAPYTHCPRGEETWTKGRCGCDPKQSFGESFLSAVVC
jgi:alpha 1,2-mannosyltransferase